MTHQTTDQLARERKSNLSSLAYDLRFEAMKQAELGLGDEAFKLMRLSAESYNNADDIPNAIFCYELAALIASSKCAIGYTGKLDFIKGYTPAIGSMCLKVLQLESALTDEGKDKLNKIRKYESGIGRTWARFYKQELDLEISKRGIGGL